MAKGSTLTVRILSDTTAFATGLKTAGTQADTLGGKMGGMGKQVAAFAGTAAAVGGIAFLKGSIEEAREAEKVMRQTAAGIESTGGAANVTSKQVEALAGKLSTMAGVDDELIQQSANLLLTFTNVRNEAGKGNDIFNQATEAALNLSAKGFGSVDGAAKMMGKALNDPIKGITALGRAGVTFSEQQKEQIKTLTETGDILGAQKIILAEVEKQVGGAAAAAADPIDKLKVSWGNLQESVGGALVPILEKLVPILISVAQFVERNADVITPLVIGLGALAAVITTVVLAQKAWTAITTAWSTVTKVATAVQGAFNAVMAMNPITLIVIAIVALVAAIVLLYTKCEWFRNLIDAIWQGIQAAWDAVLGVIKGVFEWITNNWPTLLAILTGPIGLAVLFITKNWDTIKEVFSKVLDFIVGLWDGIYDSLIDPIKRAVETVVGLGSDIIHGLWDGIMAAKDWITDKIKWLAKKILGPFAKILKIDSPSKVFAGYGRNIVQGLALGITRNAGLATRAITDLGRSLEGPRIAGPELGGVSGGASSSSSSSPTNVTLNLTASGVDPYRLGRVVLDEAAWAMRSSGR